MESESNVKVKDGLENPDVDRELTAEEANNLSTNCNDVEQSDEQIIDPSTELYKIHGYELATSDSPEKSDLNHPPEINSNPLLQSVQAVQIVEQSKNELEEAVGTPAFNQQATTTCKQVFDSSTSSHMGPAKTSEDLFKFEEFKAAEDQDSPNGASKFIEGDTRLAASASQGVGQREQCGESKTEASVTVDGTSKLIDATIKPADDTVQPPTCGDVKCEDSLCGNASGNSVLPDIEEDPQKFMDSLNTKLCKWKDSKVAGPTDIEDALQSFNLPLVKQDPPEPMDTAEWRNMNYSEKMNFICFREVGMPRHEAIARINESPLERGIPVSPRLTPILANESQASSSAETPDRPSTELNTRTDPKTRNAKNLKYNLKAWELKKYKNFRVTGFSPEEAWEQFITQLGNQSETPSSCRADSKVTTAKDTRNLANMDQKLVIEEATASVSESGQEARIPVLTASKAILENASQKSNSAETPDRSRTELDISSVDSKPKKLKLDLRGRERAKFKELRAAGLSRKEGWAKIQQLRGHWGNSSETPNSYRANRYNNRNAKGTRNLAKIDQKIYQRFNKAQKNLHRSLQKQGMPHKEAVEKVLEISEKRGMRNDLLANWLSLRGPRTRTSSSIGSRTDVLTSSESEVPNHQQHGSENIGVTQPDTLDEMFKFYELGWVRHPKCKYTAFDIVQMAKHIPADRGSFAKRLFILRCYKFGVDPENWDWSQYSKIPAVPKVLRVPPSQSIQKRGVHREITNRPFCTHASCRYFNGGLSLDEQCRGQGSGWTSHQTSPHRNDLLDPPGIPPSVMPILSYVEQLNSYDWPRQAKRFVEEPCASSHAAGKQPILGRETRHSDPSSSGDTHHLLYRNDPLDACGIPPSAMPGPSYVKMQNSYDEPRQVKRRSLGEPCTGSVPQPTPVRESWDPDPPSSGDTLRVYIVPNGYPSVLLNDEEIYDIENSILEEILKIDERMRPNFNGSSHNDGRYEVICQDQFSKNWLHRYVSCMLPNAALKIISAELTEMEENPQDLYEPSYASPSGSYEEGGFRERSDYMDPSRHSGAISSKRNLRGRLGPKVESPVYKRSQYIEPSGHDMPRCIINEQSTARSYSSDCRGHNELDDYVDTSQGRPSFSMQNPQETHELMVEGRIILRPEYNHSRNVEPFRLGPKVESPVARSRCVEPSAHDFPRRVIDEPKVGRSYSPDYRGCGVPPECIAQSSNSPTFSSQNPQEKHMFAISRSPSPKYDRSRYMESSVHDEPRQEMVRSHRSYSPEEQMTRCHSPDHRGYHEQSGYVETSGYGRSSPSDQYTPVRYRVTDIARSPSPEYSHSRYIVPPQHGMDRPSRRSCSSDYTYHQAPSGYGERVGYNQGRHVLEQTISRHCLSPSPGYEGSGDRSGHYGSSGRDPYHRSLSPDESLVLRSDARERLIQIRTNRTATSGGYIERDRSPRGSSYLLRAGHQERFRSPPPYSKQYASKMSRSKYHASN